MAADGPSPTIIDGPDAPSLAMAEGELQLLVADSRKLPVAEYFDALSHFGGPDMVRSKTGRGYIYFISVKTDLPEYRDLVDAAPIPRRYKQFALLWKQMKEEGLVIPGFEFPKPTFRAHFSEEVRQQRKATFQLLLDAAARNPDIRRSNTLRAFIGIEGSMIDSRRPSIEAEVMGMPEDGLEGEGEEAM